jgi:hypothetical protein
MSLLEATSSFRRFSLDGKEISLLLLCTSLLLLTDEDTFALNCSEFDAIGGVRIILFIGLSALCIIRASNESQKSFGDSTRPLGLTSLPFF